jgi:hypothetical protein
MLNEIMPSFSDGERAREKVSCSCPYERSAGSDAAFLATVRPWWFLETWLLLLFV